MITECNPQVAYASSEVNLASFSFQFPNNDDLILNKISKANSLKTADVVFPVPDLPRHNIFPGVDTRIYSSSVNLKLKLGIFCKNFNSHSQLS